ncbi:MAG: diguanylate cyclase [Gammaproteobacteria bacterium]
MKKPGISVTEDTRIETLRALNILDTPPEERFDRLTRIAKKSFNVPTALVSLIDDNRQWFKSSVGLEVSETPRDVSFCGHAILNDDIFIIRDARCDERFHDNPLVQGEPWIRFYAGYPLKALNGERLGTLCIIDYKPRNLNDKDAEILKDLGSMAERELSMAHIATHDDLTMINNTRGFMMLAQNNLSVCAQHGFPASLVYFDINNFKSINDTHGHSEGDKVLITVANLIKEKFRASDVCARVGGNEFAVLLGNQDKDKSLASVNKLLDLIKTYNANEKNECNVRLSYGIVEYDTLKHSSIKNMLNEGAQLIHEDKQHKKNVVQIAINQKLRNKEDSNNKVKSLQ